MLPQELLDVLVCPKSKAPLLYFARGEHDDGIENGFLVCVSSRLRYRIDAGVPVMLVEEATELPADEIERLAARAAERGIAG
ncbi:MAG TPA: Trm112 family protein [Kofleriaceae bacterium]|nr:Trm112 family protein [Kofleriaceae bacterium]